MTRTSSPLSVYNPLHHSTKSVARASTSRMSFALIACVALLPATIACGKSPTGPSSIEPTTSTSPSTRIVNVVGNLAFGDVPVGSQRSLSYTISNSGSAPLTVTGTTISGGLVNHTFFSWTNGQIPAGGSQVVTVRFQPTAAGSYNGTIAVNGDQTGGSNVVAISGSAAGASVSGTWTGRYVVERCEGTGSNQDYFCGAQNGAYPIGSSLPVSITLNQSGTSVNGTILLGRVTGPVNGTINSNGTMVLQGSASAGTVSLTLSSWNTSVAGASMSGSFAYNAGLSGIPGVAVVVSRFSGVTRQ